jgi:hypothetical protein
MNLHLPRRSKGRNDERDYRSFNSISVPGMVQLPGQQASRGLKVEKSQPKTAMKIDLPWDPLRTSVVIQATCPCHSHRRAESFRMISFVHAYHLCLHAIALRFATES